MAKELTVDPDVDSIDEDQLAVIHLPPVQHPTVSMEVSGVKTQDPIEGIGERRYSIEIEYIPEKRDIESESLVDYLKTYAYARIPQEAMARRIRYDICQALQIEDAFVMIRRESPVVKRTRMGNP